MIAAQDEYDRMFIAPNTQALVIDTDLPATDHFSDNLCAFATGLPTKLGADFWASRFFKEMSIDPNEKVKFSGKGNWPNPFTKYTRYGWQRRKFWAPCSPWATPTWGHNGYYDYVSYETKLNLNGKKVSEEDILEKYTYPAYMSVAIFFSKKIHQLQENVIRTRAAQFCKEYPNGVRGRFHNIIKIEWRTVGE